jgi:hypothetical protein
VGVIGFLFTGGWPLPPGSTWEPESTAGRRIQVAFRWMVSAIFLAFLFGLLYVVVGSMVGWL